MQNTVVKHEAWIEALTRREGEFRDELRELARQVAGLLREIADLRAELAVLKSDHAEHKRRTELWGGRWWALAAGVFLALVGVGAAIIRRQP